MMMFETSKHVPKTEKRCCVLKDNYGFIFLSRYAGDAGSLLMYTVSGKHICYVE